METDYQKLLNACKEYRAKLDEALEANNELSERLSTIPDEVWSKADLVKQIHQAYAERDDLQKENAALRESAAIIRNALEEYDSDGVNANQYRLINTVRRAITSARKEAQP